ncbi:MAG: hypothetical protein QM666_04495 [Acinetobacter sp.]
MTDKTRTQNQDDWKRTQIRIPISLYKDVVRHAEQHNLSLNYAMLELMNRGIHSIPPKSKNEEAVYRLSNSFEQKSFESLEDVPLERLLNVVMKKLGENSLELSYKNKKE